MLKQTVKFEDFNGNQVEEDLYFNFTRNEVIDMEMKEGESTSDRLKRIGKANDAPAAYREMRSLILAAYGKKSEDGRKFLKSDEIRDDFESSAAYDQFIWDLFQDIDKMTAFINGILPQEALKQAMENREARTMKLEGDDSAPAPTPVRQTENSPAEKSVGTFGQSSEQEETKPTPPPGITPEQFQEYLRNNPDALK